MQHHFLSEDGSLITSDIEGIRKHLKLTKGVEQKLMAGEVVKGWRIVLLRDCYKSLYPSPVVP